MDGRRPQALTSASLTRRQALQLTGCAPSARQASEEAGEGSLVLISTRFQPYLMDHPNALFAAGLPVRFDRFEVGGAARSGVPGSKDQFLAPAG